MLFTIQQGRGSKTIRGQVTAVTPGDTFGSVRLTIRGQRCLKDLTKLHIAARRCALEFPRLKIKEYGYILSVNDPFMTFGGTGHTRYGTWH